MKFYQNSTHKKRKKQKKRKKEKRNWKWRGIRSEEIHLMMRMICSRQKIALIEANKRRTNMHRGIVCDNCATIKMIVKNELKRYTHNIHIKCGQDTRPAFRSPPKDCKMWSNIKWWRKWVEEKINTGNISGANTKTIDFVSVEKKKNRMTIWCMAGWCLFVNGTKSCMTILWLYYGGVRGHGHHKKLLSSRTHRVVLNYARADVNGCR